MTMAQMNSLLAESAAFLTSRETVIDLAEVSEVDTSAISLLFEWLRRAHSHKCKLVFSSLPQNLISLATMYGVLELIPQSSH